MAVGRKFTALSLKQFLAIVASFVAIYFVSVHHKALEEWFAPPKPSAKAMGAGGGSGAGKPVAKTS